MEWSRALREAIESLAEPCDRTRFFSWLAADEPESLTVRFGRPYTAATFLLTIDRDGLLLDGRESYAKVAELDVSTLAGLVYWAIIVEPHDWHNLLPIDAVGSHIIPLNITDPRLGC